MLKHPTALVFKGATYVKVAEKTTWTEDTVKEVGTQLGIDWDSAEFDPKAFLEGMKVELEHGTVNEATNITNNDPEATAKIAWAHLLEDPSYYTKLKAMEKGQQAKEGSARNAIVKPCRQKDKKSDKPLHDQKVCLYSKKDPTKLLGRHPSEQAARQQEKAIHVNKKGSVISQLPSSIWFRSTQYQLKAAAKYGCQRGGRVSLAD